MSTSAASSPTIRRPTFPATFPYPDSAFGRADPSPDTGFYDSPRYVQHIDARCIDALSRYYAAVLPPALPIPPAGEGADDSEKPKVLDLCSSWTSHLPAAFAPPGTHITGLGMNASELSRNPLLSTRVVHDLNASPVLPAEVGQAVPGGKYDAVVCSVSVDYFVRPLEVFRELAKVVRKGGGAHMSFSNRCFPTKVIRRWLEVSEDERCEMVASYFHFAGTTTEPACEPGQLWEEVEIVTVLQRSWAGDPLWVVRAKRTGKDVPA